MVTIEASESGSSNGLATRLETPRSLTAQSPLATVPSFISDLLDHRHSGRFLDELK